MMVKLDLIDKSLGMSKIYSWVPRWVHCLRHLPNEWFRILINFGSFLRHVLIYPRLASSSLCGMGYLEPIIFLLPPKCRIIGVTHHGQPWIKTSHRMYELMRLWKVVCLEKVAHRGHVLGGCLFLWLLLPNFVITEFLP